MNVQQLFKTSIRSIIHHKGRSLLTTLGINIGVASIIAMLAIGNGAKEKIRREILSSGKNIIYIQGGRLNIFDSKMENTHKKERPLTMEDLQSLQRTCPTIANISSMSSSAQVIKFLNAKAGVELKAGNENLLSILNRTIQAGTFYTNIHVQSGSRVIVLGHAAAKKLFKSLDPINQIVTINHIPFIVVGVANKLTYQTDGDFSDANLDSFIPISTFQKHIEHSLRPYIRGIAISAKTYDLIPLTVKQVTQYLRMRHYIKLKDPNDFTIFDQQSILNAAKTSSDTFTFFLLVIACISLLVGGIGVMNIMLVSITERTKEIGIRMALGATQKNILAQFLTEALILCSIGGLLGIILGVIAPFVTSIFTGWAVIIKPLSIVIAFFALFIIGIVFGYYPAYKASRLNPVDALQEK
jgi:putative ABC transport system permease protein